MDSSIEKYFRYVLKNQNLNSGFGGKNGQKFEIFGGLDELYVYLLLSFHSAMVSVDFVPKQSPSGEILASVMHDF